MTPVFWEGGAVQNFFSYAYFSIYTEETKQKQRPTTPDMD